MAGFRALLSRIRGSFGGGRADQEFDAELQTHLELLAERFVRQGMTPEEARDAARRQFGGVTQTRETQRQRRGLPLDSLARDVRYAFRQLYKAPAFAAAAIITLALGIGANSAIFAVVNAVLLRPLPYSHSEQLVSVQSRDIRRGPHPSVISYPNFFDFRSRNRVLDHLVSYRDGQFTLTGEGEALHLDGEVVSWDLFPCLGIQPELGRGFLPEEEKAGTHAAVISHEVWQNHFGGDRNIIGRVISMNGNSFTVVGVAPPKFHFPADNSAIQIWTTLAEDAVGSLYSPLTVQRGARVMSTIGRLKPGISLETARAQLDQIAAALAKEYPDDNKNVSSVYVRPELERIAGDMRQPMMVLLAAVGMVLLIACGNVANLLLARSTEREREFALRSAIGASRAAVVRQLLTESMVLALLGSVVGVLLAFAILQGLVPLAANSIPRISEATMDLRVLAFSLALTLFTIILFSLAPAIKVAKSDLITRLKESVRTISGGHDRLRRTLVVAQITLGLLLLSAAGLLTAGFLRLQHRNPGFRPDHLLTFSFSLPYARYNTPMQIAFSDRLLQELRTVPGVESAAAGFPLPLAGDQIVISFDVKERPTPPAQHPVADMAIVTPGYFSTLGIPLLKGRTFTEADDAHSAPVVIVNKAFADRFFPGENPIGKLIDSGAVNGQGAPPTREIIAVVGNAKQAPLTPSDEPIYYFPYKQLSWFMGKVVLRTSVTPRSVEAAARAKVASLEREAAVYEVHDMEDTAAITIAWPRFQMLLVGSFAGIALLLTIVGLYGLLAYTVMKRTREIGVRIALGASRSQILGSVLRQAAALIAAGLGIGIVAALAGSHLLQTMLYGLSEGRSLLLLLACILIVITGMLAAYLPARRAAGTDPMLALRSE
jgi:putative ABC transport system permease protein